MLENDDIDNIIRIIRNWKYEYRNNTIIGENHYFINIMSEGKEYVIADGDIVLFRFNV
ncbi:MAG: DUF933 domain-containing protein [Clostridia bacterium]|nr:DUF933 domain-containing protein [Clostridia bacterium]